MPFDVLTVRLCIAAAALGLSIGTMFELKTARPFGPLAARGVYAAVVTGFVGVALLMIGEPAVLKGGDAALVFTGCHLAINAAPALLSGTLAFALAARIAQACARRPDYGDHA